MSVVAAAPTTSNAMMLPAVTGAPALAGNAILPLGSNLAVSDALTMVMELSASMNDAQTRSATSTAETTARLRSAATEKRSKILNDAIEKARQAAEEREDGGLFDSILDNLGPIGLVAIVVGSVYLLAADLIMHAAELDNDEMDLADGAGLACMLAGPAGIAIHAAQLCMKKFGPDELQQTLDAGPTIKDKDVRTANSIGLAVWQAQLALAATVATGGTSAPAIIAMSGIAISTTTQVMQETGALRAAFGEDARWVALGGTLIGGGLSIGGGLAMAGSGTEVARIALAAEKAKVGVQAAHDINQGIHNLESAKLQRDADRLQVAAKQQRFVIEFLERMIDAALDDLEASQETTRKTTAACQSIGQTQNQTMLIAGSLKG